MESIFRDVKLRLINYLFVMSDLSGEALAGSYSLIMTCELHGINPQDFIADFLARLANNHPMSAIDSLLPWHWKTDYLRIKVSDTDDCIEQEYLRGLLIKKLGLECKFSFDESSKTRVDFAQISEMAAFSP